MCLCTFEGKRLCVFTVGYSVSILPIKLLENAKEMKLNTNSSLWISSTVQQQVSDIRPASHCVVYQPITAAVVRAYRTCTHSHTPLSLCSSLVPSPLKRRTGGCAPLDMWACILTLETEDGHGCTL